MRLGPNLKRFLPRRLFARTILIILLPLLLAQGVAAYIFYDRHYSTLTTRLAQTTAADIDLLAEQAFDTPPAQQPALFRRWEDATGIGASFTTDGGSTVGADDYLRRSLGAALELQGISRYRFGAVDNNVVVLYLPDLSAGGAHGVSAEQGKHRRELSIRVPLRRLYTSTTLIFVLWMVGAAAALVIVSLIFMRNQIRPIRRLAEAADAFGRSIDVALDSGTPAERPFKPEGAREVRQAAAAFLVMRNRLRRMIEQRTSMLAAISHDLRTPLTRMRLQLALTPPSADSEALNNDVSEMERMIGAYLDFARGQDSEPPAQVDLARLVGTLAQQATRLGKPVFWQPPEEERVVVMLREAAIMRALNNLISNALKFGEAAWLSMQVADYTVEIVIEDNGPGIPASAREQVFKPFFRLKTTATATPAQSGQTAAIQPVSGYGMGLTITRDIARAHGGDVLLEQSVQGGLKAVLRLPR